MKLTITADESAKLDEARRLLAEVNAGLNDRGVPVNFCISTARDGLLANPDGTILVIDWAASMAT